MILLACSSEEKEQEDLPEYTLQLEVLLEQNLMFSTYDVEISIDGEKLGTVKQGETFVKDVVLTEGDHEFKANKSGDSSVKGSTTIKLDSNKAFSCSLKSHGSSIDINNQLEEPLEDYNSRKEKEKAEADAIAAAEQAEKEKQEAEEKAAQEKAEAEQKEKEEAEAKMDELAEKLVPMEGMRLSDVYDEINSIGFPVIYIATNTGDDVTSVIAEVTETYYVNSFYWDEDNDSITVAVTPEFIIEQNAAQKALEAVLSPSVAWGNAEMYGKQEYGNSFNLKVSQMLGERVSDDGTAWVLKAPCEVNGVEMTCEATVTGTNDNPVVIDFLVY